MDIFSHSPGLEVEAKNSVDPLSVEDFLFPLVRIPTPERFDGRHQHLLFIKPRLSRTRENVDPTVDPVSRVRAMSLESVNASESLFVDAGIPSEDHYCQRPSESNSVSAISVQVKDEPMKSQVCTKYQGPPNSSSVPVEQIQTEKPNRGHLEQVFAVLVDQPSPLPLRKLRRPIRKQYTAKKAVEYGEHLEQQKIRKRPRTPRRLPVDELELVSDRVQSYLSSDSDVEVAELDGDPIQAFTSPSSGSKLTSRRRTIGKAPKKRKSLSKLQRKNLHAAFLDLSLFKFPKPYDISTNAEEHLKACMTCSDGFEGKEIKATGRTIPTRTSHSFPQSPRQPFVYVPELTLTSSRDPIDHRLVAQKRQGELYRSTLYDVLEHEHIYRVMNADRPLAYEIAEAPEEKSVMQVPGQDLQSKRLRLSCLADNKSTEEIPLAVAPFARPKLRVKFSEDVEVRQTLMMVSAPIRLMSPCESDNSKDMLTNDDRSTIGSSNGENKEGNNEANNNDSNADAEVEVEDELQYSGAAAKDNPKIYGVPVAFFEQTYKGHNSICSRCEIEEDASSVQLPYMGPRSANEMMPMTKGECQRHEHLGHNPWGLGRPVSTPRPIAVYEECPESPHSSTELLSNEDENVVIHSSRSHKGKFQPEGEHIMCPIKTSSEFVEEQYEREHSQVSIELGDPNWLIPYGQEEEHSYSQEQNRVELLKTPDSYIVEEGQTYLAQPLLETFSRPLQRIPS